MPAGFLRHSKSQSGKRSPNIDSPLTDLGLGRLVLKHVPMLGELAILDADDVSGDPGRGPAMRDHVVTLGNDELVVF